MPLLAFRAVGFAEYRARLVAARYMVLRGLYETVSQVVLDTTAGLEGAAPVGSGPTDKPPGDDAPGPLFRSFEPAVAGTPTEPFVEGTVRTSQPTKLKFITKGTGIYGPTGQRIFPRSASALSWIDPVSGLRITRRSVAGIQPNDFVSPVLDAARVQAVVALREAVEEAKAFLR